MIANTNAVIICSRNRPRYQIWKVAVAMLVAGVLTFVFVKYKEYAHTGSLELRENFGHSVLVVCFSVDVSTKHAPCAFPNDFSWPHPLGRLLRVLDPPLSCRASNQACQRTLSALSFPLRVTEDVRAPKRGILAGCFLQVL